MKIERFIVGPFQTNMYVVNDEHDVLIIDPACYTENEKQMVLDYIESFHLSSFTFHLLATHGHLDHLWGAAWATEKWNIPVLMHEADIPLAQAMQQQYDLFGIPLKAKPFPIEPFTFHLSPFTLIHTPGHTPGSICLYFPNDQSPMTNHQSPILFSGDTLFQMGYGRTDLPGGNYGQLIDSLEKLFALPADVKVYPGHGDFTTIGAECRA